MMISMQQRMSYQTSVVSVLTLCLFLIPQKVTTLSRESDSDKDISEENAIERRERQATSGRELPAAKQHHRRRFFSRRHADGAGGAV
ncbi:hypothetical protein F5Y08DRAFT_321845 [Xylaria arbuscula]|nr:hypothetical protein F5Y08DRAFT_321845 [Xylaria arbuscula]